VLGEQLDDVPGELAAGVDVRRAWRDTLVGQLAHTVTQGGLLVAENGHRRIVAQHDSLAALVLSATCPDRPLAGGVLTVTDNEPERIRVLLVDDHAVVRRGLRGFLELLPDIEIVAEAENGQQALELARRHSPDVVLMDLLMPVMDGLEATAAIKQAQPEVEIVAVTSFIEEEKVATALDAGASGYLLKDATADEVAAAIRGAHAGELQLDPAVARLLAQRLRSRATTQPVESLTAREREVLAELASGASNKEIAYRLSITERTARTHVSNILAKLGLASRTQAALWAVEHKVV
jgi:DNA-binding NarL/FixJ family response regulator